MNRILKIFNNLFVLWVVLGGLAAYFYPDVFVSLKKYMEWFFALTMFGVLALKHFNEKVALPAVIFVFICIFSAAFLVPIWSRSRLDPES